MNELAATWYNAAVGILGGLLIAWYFGAFLKTKHLQAAGLGAAYFTMRFLLEALFDLAGIGADDGFSVFVVMLARYIIVFLSLFMLSQFLFRAGRGLSSFLLCSFLAVQEISMLIAVCVFSMLGNIVVFATDHFVLTGAVSSLEEVRTLINTVVTGQFVLHLAIYILCVFFTLRYINKSFRHRQRSFLPVEWLYLIVPCLVGIVVVSIPFEALMNSARFVQIPFNGWIGALAGFCCLLIIAGAVRLFQKMIDLRVEESESAVLRRQTAQLQEQMHAVDDMYAEIKGIRHDIKNHAANIGLLALAAADGDELSKTELNGYLYKLEEALDRFDFAFQTGNSISDVIIHQKYLEAKKSGVDFSSDFIYPKDMGLDPYDLAVILSNALENAVEACLSLPPQNRFIRVGSRRKGNMFFIEIQNSFADEIVINRHTGLPQSGKNDKSAHGMGLGNIRRCARKHFGEIDIALSQTGDEKLFRLTVMLQGEQQSFTANKP